ISSTCATGRTGQPFSFRVLADNATSTGRFTAGGLPPGLTIDPITGVISGIPTSDGNFAVAVGLVDGATSTNAVLQLTFVSDASAPVITSRQSAILLPGQSFSYTIAAD